MQRILATVRLSLRRSALPVPLPLSCHEALWRPSVPALPGCTRISARSRVSCAAASSSAPLRSLHCSAAPLAELDAQTMQQAAAWNLAARLGTIDEVNHLAHWLKSFKKASMPVATFDLRHARSSGAGGQNVNKVNTKVDIRFKIDKALWLPPLARRCLKELESGRVNVAGEFVVTSERTRTQGENYQDCIDKLYAMILKACELPKATEESKVDRIVRLANAQKARRRTDKTFRSDKKWSDRESYIP